MLIPAFSNKITNVTSKMRLRMLFVFNGLWVPSRGTWQVGTHVESRIHLQAFLHPAPNAAFNIFSSDFITKEMELIIIPTL